MLEEVKKLISEQLNVSVDKITEDSRMVEDLGADSLDTVEMLMTLEDKFGISISDEVAAKLKNVGEISNMIEEKLKEKK